jgi:hypothetical protein
MKKILTLLGLFILGSIITIGIVYAKEAVKPLSDSEYTYFTQLATNLQ